MQSSFDSEKGSVRKVRPIDDYTESLANPTSCGEETIAPHSIDVILAGLVFRARTAKLAGVSECLVAKTVDLEKPTSSSRSRSLPAETPILVCGVRVQRLFTSSKASSYPSVRDRPYRGFPDHRIAYGMWERSCWIFTGHSFMMTMWL